MSYLSEKAKLPPSATNTIHAMAVQKNKAGVHVYNYAAGDPVLINHETIIHAAEAAVKEGFVPYAPVAGIADLRIAVAHWMNGKYKSQYAMENVLVTCGGKFAIYAAMQALLNDGDELLIQAPYWVSYPDMVRLSGGVPKIIVSTKEKGWKISPEDIAKHATQKTRAIILNNGCNPTGVLYSHEEMQALLKAAKAADLFIISDEVYSELVYDGKTYTSAASFHEVQDRLVIVHSCSKIFGMAGWRVGFAIGPAELIKAMTMLQSQMTTGTSLIGQRAALAAVKNEKTVCAYVRKEMQKRRDLFVDTYNSLFDVPIEKPSSAIYAFIHLKGAEHSVKLCERILAEANVAVVPGIAFGVEGYVRFAFSESEEEIIGGLHALKKMSL